MNKKRKMISLITALCLALSMIPMSVWAIDEVPQTEEQQNAVVETINEEGITDEELVSEEPAEEELAEDTEEVEEVVNGTVTDVKSYATYKGIDLTWTGIPTDAEDEVEYSIYDAETGIKVGQTKENQFYAKVSDEAKHTYQIHVIVKGIEHEEYAISPAKTKVLGIKYNLTFGSKCKLTCWTSGHKKHKKTFKKGQQLVADEFSKGCYRYTENGHRYSIKRVRLKSVNAKGWYNSKKPYSREEITRYVNRRGISSKKKTMVFVSTKSQHLYLFKGSKGKWKCDRDWIVSTGSPNTPTPTGSFKFKYKWSIHNGLRYWSACSTFSFHGKASQWKLGKPKSGGCVRNENSQAKYIYNKYKCGSKVVVV